MSIGRFSGTLHLTKMESDIPSTIEIGQTWSAWGEAILKFDPRYGASKGYDEQRADEVTMLSAPNLFRFVGTG